MNVIFRTSRPGLLVAVLGAIASPWALAVFYLICAPARVSASAPVGSFIMILTSIAPAPDGGFWLQRDGSQYNAGGVTGTYPIDGAPPFPTIPHRGSIISIPGRVGYWVVTDQGAIDARGDAPILCDGQLSTCSAFPSKASDSQIITAAAATPDGKGLWAVGRDGKLWTAGSARPYGDVTKQHQTPTGIVATPSGLGYYIVLADGGVFSFGDAVFYGSTGGIMPGGHQVTGMAASLNADGQINGYWLVFDDGAIFTFGKAPFLGSTGGNSSGSVVTGIVARPNRLGYAWVHLNGGIEYSAVPNVVITSKEFGNALSAPNGAAGPGEALQLLPTNGSTSQLWSLKPTSGVAEPGNVVQLVNIKNGLCADVTGSGPEDARMIQFPCKTKAQGWENQLWRMINQNGAAQFIYYGQPADQPHYTLAADSDGSLFLEPSDRTNAGWVLTGVP